MCEDIVASLMKTSNRQLNYHDVIIALEYTGVGSHEVIVFLFDPASIIMIRS